MSLLVLLFTFAKPWVLRAALWNIDPPPPPFARCAGLGVVWLLPHLMWTRRLRGIQFGGSGFLCLFPVDMWRLVLLPITCLQVYRVLINKLEHFKQSIACRGIIQPSFKVPFIQSQLQLLFLRKFTFCLDMWLVGKTNWSFTFFYL